ncbi:MAG: hypothetical protein B7C54_08980 [Acidimicrobiales bacterium mtb01]|nr:endolytic transglycosylase MltG [Actinomycetota bacterium]TEX45237.1 MAG: hypothetical protein B7C54_08980 [Acidimicrobiales bacterium mtb01]
MMADRDEVGASNDDPYEVVPQIHLSRGRRTLKQIALFILAGAILGVVSYGWSQWRYLQKVNPSGDPAAATTFEVRESDDLRSVSNRLEDLGIVVDSGTFRRYVGDEGGLDLVPGFYTLRPRDHMGNLLRALRTSPAETFVKVTFPEGFTVVQMAERLAEEIPGFDPEAFIARALDPSSVPGTDYVPPGASSLEGLLFPDTYSFAVSEKPVQILKRMVDLMERVGRQEGLDDAPTLLGLSPYEVLTVASLIEREAKVAADRPRIARVIYNRLALGMNLEVDASLFYGQDPDRDFASLKALDTPYNTYLRGGLPPTPIANPGRASIAAALAPAPNPRANDPICRDIPANSPCVYLYYVLIDEDGNHAFSSTLQQHEANIAIAKERGVL